MTTLTLGTHGFLSARWIHWVGRVFSALPILAMVAASTMKLTRQPAVMDVMVGTLGFTTFAVISIGALELASAVLYAIPRTAGLGAVLATGFFGGAIATHVRAGQNFGGPLLLGVLVWAGLYLRDERIRDLLPLRHVDRPK